MDDDIWNIIMLCTILFMGAGLFTFLVIVLLAFFDFLTD